MAFKTGRSRTITYTGSMSAEDVAEGNQTPAVYKVVFFQYLASALNASCSAYNCTGTAPGSLSPTNGTVSVSDSDTGTSDSQTYHTRPVFPSNYAIGVGGSWSVTVTVEEWCDIYVPTTVSVLDGTSFPAYSSPAVADGIPAAGARFYEKTKIGTTKSVSMTVNGVTASCGGTITSEVEIGYAVSYSGFSYLYATVYALTPPFSVPGYSSSIAASSSPALGADPATYTTTYYDGGTAAVATVGDGISINLYTESGSSSDTHLGGSILATFSASGTPPTDYALSARLNSFADSYIGYETLSVNDRAGHVSTVDLAPTGSLAFAQKAWSYSFALNDLTASKSYNDIQPVSCYLSGAGEDVRDWRMQFRGYKRDAATLAHSSSQTLDDGSSTTGWAAGSSTTVAAVTDSGRSVVRLSASGGSGSATRTWSPAQTTEAYRYLRVVARASAACTVSLAVAGKTWSVPLTTGYQNVDLDLCCSGDETGPLGTIDTRYPIQSNGGFPTNTPPSFQYSLGWGVNYLDTAAFSGVPNGVSVYVDSIAIIRKTDARLTLLAPFLYFPTGWINNGGGGGDVTSLQPYAYFQADAKGPLDFPHGALVSPNTAPAYHRMYAISELVTMWNAVPGLSATNLSASSDGYHSNSNLAMILGGGGSTYNHSTPGWTDWVDVDLASGTITIPAQDLLDEVQSYPSAGEVWTAGSYGSATNLVAGKSLRGQAYGLAYDQSRSPYQGVAVLAQDASGVFAGTATVTADARYLTGLPYGRGNLSVSTSVAAADYELSSTDVWQNRMRQRTSFVVAPVPCAGTPPRLPNDCAPSSEGTPIQSSCGCGMGECSCGQSKVKRLPQPEVLDACR